MEGLEKKALEEVYSLLSSFEAYRFYDLIRAKDPNLDKEQEYSMLSNREFSKIDKAKLWVAAILDEL